MIAIGILVALSGCAPIATLERPGMVTAVPPEAPGHPESNAFDLGEVLDAPRDSLVILLVGDNRPGYRMQSQRFGYPQLAALSIGKPRTWLPALVGLPAFLVQAFVPTLDGFQDLSTALFTHRPNGGREAQVRRAMEAQLPAQMVINTGDLVFDGRRARLWEDFVRKFGTPNPPSGEPGGLRGRSLYLATPGNHERMHTPEGAANWSAAMGAPARPGRFWSSLDVGEGFARFVFIDSNVLANVDGIYPAAAAESLSNEQLDWLDRALDTPARYKFVVMHHPLVMVGNHASDWAPEASSRRRDRVLEICARRGVTAILAGHEHLYHRVPTADARSHVLWQITTGGGGGPLHYTDAESRAREVARSAATPPGLRTLWSPAHERTEEVHHFCRLVLAAESSAGRSRLDAYEVDRSGHATWFDRVWLDSPPITIGTP